MQVKFDRHAPMFLRTMEDELAFDGVVVDLPDADVRRVFKIKNAVEETILAIAEAGAPEDSAQELATAFVTALRGRA